MLNMAHTKRGKTFEGDMGEDDFVVCRVVFFAWNPFDHRGYRALRFCRIGARHFDVLRKDGSEGCFTAGACCWPGCAAEFGKVGDRENPSDFDISSTFWMYA